jgi:hypothetical protein
MLLLLGLKKYLKEIKMIIEDGTGQGYKLKINKLNRANADAVTFDREDDAIVFGAGYQITSGQVTFTTSEASGVVLFFKNDEDVDCVLDRVVLMIGTGDTSGDWYHRILRNPDAGTIISNAVKAGISNSNHGSANQLNGDGRNIFKGIQGDTATGGTGVALPVQANNNRIVFPVGRRLPKGSSFAVEITPPTINSGSVIAVSVAHVFLDVNQ